MTKKKLLKHIDWFGKLTEAEKTIWKMIYNNPTMITSRSGALNLLFCVYGTGLDWNNGEIIDSCDENYLSGGRKIYSFEKDLYKKAYTNTFWGKESMGDRLDRNRVEWMRAYNFYENCVAEHTQRNIEALVTTKDILKSFYPLCEYSKLMTVPKDVKPDWLELALETCDAILACDPMHKCLNDRLQNKDNIKLAKRQKAKLLKIKQRKVKK